MHSRDDILSALPDEVLLEILKKIETTDSKSVATTNKHLNSLWQDKSIWQDNFKNDFPSAYRRLEIEASNHVHTYLLKKKIHINESTLNKFMKMAIARINFKQMYDTTRKSAYDNVPPGLKQALECIRNNNYTDFLKLDLSWEQLNTSDNTGDSILSLCCARNDDRFLLQIYTDLVNSPDADFKSPLYWAIVCRQDNDAIRLIGEGEHLLNPDEAYLTLAVEENSLAVCKALLAHQVDTEVHNEDGFTALGRAALDDKLDFVEALVRGGALITASAGDDGPDVLGLAVANQRVLQWLIQSGNADVNSYSAEGFTCLQQAINAYAVEDDSDVATKYHLLNNIQFLLENGADPRLIVRSESLESAIDMAKGVLPRSMVLKLEEKAQQLTVNEADNTNEGRKRQR